MKKIFVWIFMFALLGGYTGAVAVNYNDGGLAYAYATTERHPRAENRYERIIERLTIRMEAAERKCDTLPEKRARVHCKRADFLAHLIAVFSGHVS